MVVVSIIIPVYRTEMYLEACVKSVLAQSYRDYELILVDDGSPDCSGSLCDYYAASDSRVKVIHKQNGGVSSARNAGLDVARGEYVMFLDSDDWFHEQFLERAVSTAKREGLDMYLAGATFWETDTKQHNCVIDQSLLCRCGELDDTTMCLLFGKNYISSCWGTLYRKEFIGTQRFEEGCSFGEDLRFVFSLLEKQGKLLATTEALYFYRGTPDSATKHFDEKKIKDVTNTYLLLAECAEKNDWPNFRMLVQNRWLTDYQYIQDVVLSCDLSFAARYRRLRGLLMHPQLRDIVRSMGNECDKKVASNPGLFLLKRQLIRMKNKMMSR